jgi:hypothetical protein
MVKKTLLAMTQDILSEMDSDEINSIDDTVEAQQVASIIRGCYNEMISNRNWPHLKKLIKLDALADITKPTYLKLPNEMKELITFKYDCHKKGESKVVYKEIKYLEPEAFLRFTSQRNSDNTNVSTITDFSGTPTLVFNNLAPSYWTSFDDLYIVTDSYDASLDNTLKQSKTQVLAYMEPTWVHENDAIPDLPSEAFSALEEEAKSTAFFVLKQMVNSKSEQKAGRQQRWLSRKAWRAAGGVQYANFGRKGRR